MMKSYIWKPVAIENKDFTYHTELPWQDNEPMHFSLQVSGPTSMLKTIWLSVADYWSRASIPLPDHLRLCELVQTDASNAYSHRNGETEAPTKTGLYFYVGKPGSGWTEGIAEIAHAGIERKLIVWRAWQDGWDWLPQSSVYWWGPIVPPWEDEAGSLFRKENEK